MYGLSPSAHLQLLKTSTHEAYHFSSAIVALRPTRVLHSFALRHIVHVIYVSRCGFGAVAISRVCTLVGLPPDGVESSNRS